MNKATKNRPSPMRGVNNLVQAWLHVEQHEYDNTLTEALHRLNTALGSAHTSSRVHEWAKENNNRGSRLPRSIRVYMMRRVMRYVLTSCNIEVQHISTRTLNKLIEKLN